MNPSATRCKRTTQGTRSWTQSDAWGRRLQLRGWSCCIQVSLNNSIRYERRLMPLYCRSRPPSTTAPPCSRRFCDITCPPAGNNLLPILKVDYLHSKKALWGDHLYTTFSAAPPSSSAWSPADGVQCAPHGSQFNIPVSSSSNQVECRSPLSPDPYSMFTLFVHLLILPLQVSAAPYWAAL